MTTIINANTSAGLVYTADTSGIVKLQSAGVTTNALVWVVFAGGNGNTSGTIVNSYNVSSITVVGTGQWTVNYTNALQNGNIVGLAAGFGANTVTNYACTQAGYNGFSATSTQIRHWESNAAQPVEYVAYAVFGN